MVDKLNPATWAQTGETMPDGAPVLINPGSGAPCVMPRATWPNPMIPRSPQVYRNECRERIESAAPDLIAELRKAESFIAGFEDDELQEGIAELLCRLSHSKAALMIRPLLSELADAARGITARDLIDFAAVLAIVAGLTVLAIAVAPDLVRPV